MPRQSLIYGQNQHRYLDICVGVSIGIYSYAYTYLKGMSSSRAISVDMCIICISYKILWGVKWSKFSTCFISHDHNEVFKNIFLLYMLITNFIYL